MGWRLYKTIVMVGMPGSGKTVIGTALASRLNVPFKDSDAEIVEASNMTIGEIFDKYGESFFREKETQVIARLLAEQPKVLAVGGGAFLQGVNREAIAKGGVSLWLDVDMDLLWERVRHKETRPLLLTPNPQETLAELYEKRVPKYAGANLSVKACHSSSVDDMVERILPKLLECNGVLRKIT